MKQNSPTHSFFRAGCLSLLLLAFSSAAGAEKITSEERYPAERWKARMTAGELSPEQVAEGAALALQAQEDVLVHFDSRWGDFLELARVKGVLSDETWRAYLLGAVRPRNRVPPGATRAGGLLLLVEQELTRAGGSGLPVAAEMTREDDVSGIVREARTAPFDPRKPAAGAPATG